MKVLLKDGLLVVAAETDEERASVEAWAAGVDRHAFVLKAQGSGAFRLVDIGPRSEACREPINVISLSTDPTIRLISNYAHTPFEQDGLPYASVEGFWQGLKFPVEADRRRIAELHGNEARKAAFEAQAEDTFAYQDRAIRTGTADHWDLMAQACRAKFGQHDAAREALLGTGERPLEHKVRRDSRTIPGVIMAEIWMKVRRSLRKAAEEL